MLELVLLVQFAIGAVVGYVAAKALRYIIAVVAGLLLSAVIGAVAVSVDPSFVEGFMQCVANNWWTLLRNVSVLAGPYIIGLLFGLIVGSISK